jgi:PhzF family phenazine biosynthesis protein
MAEPVMQAIAAEMNLSETAFVVPLDGPAARGTRFALRWFTPQVEVPLCGHATLAAATVIFAEQGNPASELYFETKSGVLVGRRHGARTALDLPAADIQLGRASPAVMAALGLHEVKGVCQVRQGRNLLIQHEVRELAPDFAALLVARADEPFLGVIVTAAGSGGYDFVSRYFAPWVGVNEDPVTGAAHCALGPYWAGMVKKTELRAYQASKRGGELTVQVHGERVALIGEAVIVTAGTLRAAEPAGPREGGW